mmetsp:Transcript_34382/g.118526  ORF Transcript_34382/g.118526 Transcript_34382/m.118526 type:complete len:139 (-) Transcript_34382:40-456(-)
MPRRRRWQPFDATDACGACRAQFTWHTTSATATAAFREKHNCRECGLLVCDPCSRRRKPLSHVGLLVPSRVCDRCFFRGNDDDADDANDDADDDAVWPDDADAARPGGAAAGHDTRPSAMHKGRERAASGPPRQTARL